MTQVTVRPNGSSGLSGVTASAGTLQSCVDDDPVDDATYGEWSSTGNATLTFPNPTPPGSSIPKEVWIRMRDKRQISGYLQNPFVSVLTSFTGRTVLSGEASYSQTNMSVFWSSYTTHQIGAALTAEANPTSISVQVVRVWQDGTYDYWRLSEMYVTAVFVVQPTLNVTAPTGTVAATGSPEVVWTPTLDSDGGAVTHFEVKVFTAAEYGAGGFNPTTSAHQWGTVDSTDTMLWPRPVNDGNEQSGRWIGLSESTSGSALGDKPGLLADGNYRAYVRVAQTVNGALYWSAWDYEGFTMTTPKPANPTLTATANNSNGRIALVVNGSGGGAETTDFFTLERSLDQVTWLPVRTTPLGTAAPRDRGIVDYFGSPVTVYDYEAGNGQTVYYRARAAHKNAAPSYTQSITYSTAYAADSESWTSTSWWLKHPTSPALNVAVEIRSQPGRGRAARRGIQQPLGATEAVVIVDTPGPWTGDLVLKLTSDNQRAAVDAIISDPAALLIQAPTNIIDWDDRWVSIGDQGRERVIDQGWNTVTFDTLPWTEVARPG